jgi:hypothetical protein
MVEGIIGFPDMLSFAQTVGIVGTMVSQDGRAYNVGSLLRKSDR